MPSPTRFVSPKLWPIGVAVAAVTVAACATNPSGPGAPPGFAWGGVATVRRQASTVREARYRVDAAADPVTGKTTNDDVVTYTFWRQGQQVLLRLSGPHGADNVDPWKIVSDSFRWVQ